jgi:type II secretory ATPase GspE/PulE/Tfp pilus assembly ATPase PilB-like protein
VDFFRGDVMANARRALEKDGLIGGHLDTIITALIAIAIFAVIYWLIPGTILSRLAKGGNLVAGSWRLKVPWIGLLALVMYYIQTGSSNREDRRAAAKAGCPHCGARLDRPSDYTDLVFTKCPKCKGAITPIHTLEGYIKELADGLASDVERVHRGVESMERFVGRDAVGILVRALITLGVRRRASDLHFEPTEEAMVVRQRIDGMITEMTQLPRSLSAALVSAIKVQSNLNIAEKRVPQDGKMQMHIDKTDIDIRVATSPSGAGEKASLRLLDIRSIQMDTRHLGMSPSNEEIFNRAISAPHGLILVSGPTGSGKTTTIYVALQQLKKTSKNIISIEDPIEFRIPGVSQMQVNVAQGLTFASGLRSILRQDPDVIMVGEIRDRETAEISVNSAQTGHLVFSTLHTIDAAASIARLIDLGVNPRMFVDALNLIVAQRLIRLACSHCAAEDVPDLAVLRELGIDNESIGQYKFRRGLGCHVCNGTGYFRRSGLFECLEPSDRLRVAIEKGSLSTGEIREVAIKGGLRTLRMEALDLLARGLTPAEEVLRVTK